MPTSSGEQTRREILDAAEGLILERGFSGTSIDAVLERAGITKGAFFYHFESKAELARVLIHRYAESDLGHLRRNMARAERLARDPLQQLLVFVGLFLEVAEGLEEPYPGCLFASYCYESGQLEQETLRVVSETFLAWRRVLGAKLREAAALHPPRFETDLDSLADMMTVVFEGAFIMSRVLAEPKAFARQLRLFRNYLELLFAPDPGDRSGTERRGATDPA